ncbi:MAG: AAA family ATPase [Myxococcota bacterium]
MKTELHAVPAACTQPHRAALEQLRSHLRSLFVEREEVIDGLLLALLSKNHVLLVGPPGTGKSALVDALVDAIDGADSFSWLVSKFSTPEEILGPISLQALKQDRLRRMTQGKLPTAHVAFLDEVSKASSAILNTTLGITNERRFSNDGQLVACPLMTLVGASNELPTGDELEAFFDRFVLRFELGYVRQAESFRVLLTGTGMTGQATLSMAQLEQCQAEVDGVRVPDEIVEALLLLRQQLEERGFTASDRRWRQSLGVVKARALLEGEDEGRLDHLEALSDMLWRRPQDRPELAQIVGTIANPAAARATEILDAAREAVAKLPALQGRDPDERAQWLGDASRVESRLSAMEAEIQTLIQGANGRTRRAKEALLEVKSQRRALTRRVAQVYGLGAGQ